MSFSLRFSRNQLASFDAALELNGFLSLEQASDDLRALAWLHS
jgi:hypothetical protein